MYTTLILLPLVAATIVLSGPAWSSDARSIALGGSAIANGKGAHGALENPASMMEMKRAGQRTHFRFGASAEFRNSGDLVDVLSEDINNGLINDIQDEGDELTTRDVQCDPIFGNANDVCIDNTQSLSDLAERLFNVANDIRDESLDIKAAADLGIAFTQTNYPVAVNLRVLATGSGFATIVDSDLDYINELSTALDGNSLTLEEVQNSNFIEADAFGVPLSVDRPQDILQSDGNAGVLLRTQLGIGFATTFNVSNYTIDAGITPKFSSLTASFLFVDVADEFDDTTDSIESRFDDTEITESSFTFDIGASMALPNSPLRIAAVIRNALAESIQTQNGFEFETTPQIIVGAVFKNNALSITADAALNEAEQDNFESQKFSLGIELGFSSLDLRAGLSHDAARDEDKTALTFGLGLGPLQLGARLSDVNSTAASAQISYSF